MDCLTLLVKDLHGSEGTKLLEMVVRRRVSAPNVVVRRVLGSGSLFVPA